MCVCVCVCVYIYTYTNTYTYMNPIYIGALQNMKVTGAYLAFKFQFPMCDEQKLSIHKNKLIYVN